MKKEYFIQRNNTFYTKKTKEQIFKSIDFQNPTSFLPILKEMDYPYIEREWNKYLRKYGPKANILGRYIALMRLKSYSDFAWEDSELFNNHFNKIGVYKKMFHIIDNRGSGKTSRLMLLAKEHNGILVCANPYAMKDKAISYGLTGFDIISYIDYMTGNYDINKPLFIDELDRFLQIISEDNIAGYSLTIGD